MSERENKIVAKYAKALEEESLSEEAMAELIKLLSTPSRKDEKDIDEKFWATFGGWPSDKPAEEIAAEIRAARQFRDKDLTF